jgi:hypothetical protein
VTLHFDLHSRFRQLPEKHPTQVEIEPVRNFGATDAPANRRSNAFAIPAPQFVQVDAVLWPDMQKYSKENTVLAKETLDVS